MTLKKNTYASITIDTLLPFGSGQGICEGTPVVVPNTVPGDCVDIKIIKLEKQRAIAKLLEITTPSPIRQEPTCSVASQCGGCQLQHVDYEAQIEHKAALLESALGKSISVVPAASPLHYRNKLQMTFGRDQEGKAILGLYATHSNRIVDAELCHIVHPDIQDLLSDIRAWMKVQKYIPYHLVIRHGLNTGGLMVIFVIDPKHVQLKETLLSSFSGNSKISSLWICENSDPEASVLTDSLTHLHGQPVISDSLLGIHFEISPLSFVQNNPAMTKTLYSHVNEILSGLSVTTLWDLYCGIGVMTQACASAVETCVGVENVPVAIENAKASAVKNVIQNCEFVCDDATNFVGESLKTDTPDAVIVDPPRKGCSKELLTSLADKKIAHIIYVSCSPQSLVRDVQILSNMSYSIDSVLGFDCFPNTVHVETVVHLKYTGS